MDPITSMFSSVMEKASEVAEVVGDKFMKDVCPDSSFGFRIQAV